MSDAIPVLTLDERDRLLLNELLGVLLKHVGERGRSEGAVECLKRVVAERDAAVYCWEHLTGEHQIEPGVTPDMLAARSVFASWHNASWRVIEVMQDGAVASRAWQHVVEAARQYVKYEHQTMRALLLEG